jgi:hypothetical protein
MSRFLWFLSVLLFTFLPLETNGQVLFGYVLYKSRDCQSYTYDIDLYFYQSTGSTVLFGAGYLYFGDGSDPESFDVENPDSVIIYREQYALRIFKTSHTYPGPGTYTIKYREYNRVSRIKNMENSVNTAFYVESRITIDPYNGCNNSPVITNLLPLNNDINNPFIFSLLSNDIDGDSISYRLTIPKMDIAEPVKNYWIPRSKNEKNDIVLSELFLNSPTGEIIWQFPNDAGLFNFSLQVHEWRYLASLKEWINMGYVTYDFNTNILDNDNSAPAILDIKDTALIAGNNLTANFRIEDMENDSTRVIVLSDIYPKNHLTHSLEENIFYPTPINGFYRIDNTSNLVRNRPYKLVISTFQKNDNSIETQQSVFIWIVEEGGKPDPPSDLSTFLTFRNKIGLQWNDNAGNEAGYIVERADYFFPEYIRIAALPKNTTEFIDENVIPNRDYYYRIKAIGTGGSAYSDTLEVRELDIITGIEESIPEHDFIIYPNPVHETIMIQFGDMINHPQLVEIRDMTGRIRLHIDLNAGRFSDPLSIPAEKLPPGVYLLRLVHSDFISTHRFIKQ